jgi:hypothetical protein
MPFDFSANRTVEDLTKVPEDFRGFYKEASDGSGHVLDEANPVVVSAVKVIGGLWTTVANQRREIETKVKTGVEGALAPLSEYGADANAILEAVTAKLDEAKKSGVRGSKDQEAALEKLRKDLGDVHVAKERQWEESRTGLIGQIRRLLVDNQIGEALGDRALSPKVAKRVIGDFVDIEEDEGGNFRTIVRDPVTNEPRKRVTDGGLLTVQELVGELATNDEYKPLFKSEAPKGSGSSPGGPGKRVEHTPPAAQKSYVDKITAGLRKGQQHQ